MSIIGWIILGALAGWIAGFITKGGYGVLGDILCGITGAILAGWVTGALLGRDLVNSLSIESLIVSILGAVVVIMLVRAFSRGRTATLSR